VWCINVQQHSIISSKEDNFNYSNISTEKCHERRHRNNEHKMEIMLDPARHNNQNVLERLSGVPKAVADNLFTNCQPTCKVKILPGCPYWYLETFDCQNNSKAVGGDELYLTYTDRNLALATVSDYKFQPGARHTINVLGKNNTMKPASAVAWLVDENNGRYQIDFQASPMSPQSYSGHGFFSIYFQYTCDIGRMAYPAKSSWSTGGETVAWAQSDELHIVPPIRIFEPPTVRPNILNYSTIVPVGDSLLKNFLSPHGYGSFPNIRKPLNSTTLHVWKKIIKRGLNKAKNNDSFDAAVIAGSCAWDIIENQDTFTTSMDIGLDEWKDHREALINLITYVHKQYPGTNIYWKSCSGFHIHIPYLNTNITIPRIKYMSTSRALSIHKVQKEVIATQQAKKNGNVYFIDVYSAFYLSADRYLPGDGRHFDLGLNAFASDWFTGESV
jgi:hypothetical protein